MVLLVLSAFDDTGSLGSPPRWAVYIFWRARYPKNTKSIIQLNYVKQKIPGCNGMRPALSFLRPRPEDTPLPWLWDKETGFVVWIASMPYFIIFIIYLFFIISLAESYPLFDPREPYWGMSNSFQLLDISMQCNGAVLNYPAVLPSYLPIHMSNDTVYSRPFHFLVRGGPFAWSFHFPECRVYLR